MRNKFYIIPIICSVLFWSGCSSPELPTDLKFILENETNNVIIPIYRELNEGAKTLILNLEEFKTKRDQSNLDAIRTTWVACREPWEYAEAFIFGPVKNQGFDVSMDSWPLVVENLDTIIAGNKVLDKDFLDVQAGFIKGFHTIEYLVWGKNSDKKPADFTEREIDYAIACAKSLQGNTQKLYDYWRPGTGGGNFGSNLINAGDRSIYATQRAAIQELAQGMVKITDELANSKMFNAYDKKNLDFEESRFSKNSKNDFISNIDAVSFIYSGKYKTTKGDGLSYVVNTLNPELDKRITIEIEEVRTAIKNIPGTYSDAIFTNGEYITTAISKTLTLQQTLTTDLFPELLKIK